MGLCHAQQVQEHLIPTENPTRKHQTTPVEDEKSILSQMLSGLFGELEGIGDGATSSVTRVSINQNHPMFKEMFAQSHTTTECALKRVTNFGNDRHFFMREVRALVELDHPNIVGYLGHMESLDDFWIAQEYYSGGTVQSRLSAQKEPFSEFEAAEITRQILGAVTHMHSRGIVHRDIKLENIVFATASCTRVVIIDFGQARTVYPTDEFSDWAGTPAFMAPECVRTRTGADLMKVDVWAVGMCVYLLLTGRLPWRMTGINELFSDIQKKRINFSGCSQKLSREAMRFVRTLLTRRSMKRPSAREALGHEWIVKNDGADDAVEEECNVERLDEGRIQFDVLSNDPAEW